MGEAIIARRGGAIIARRGGAGSLSNMYNGKLAECIAIENIPDASFIETALTNITDGVLVNTPCTVTETGNNAIYSDFCLIEGTEKVLNICYDGGIFLNVIDSDGTRLTRTFVSESSFYLNFYKVLNISKDFYAIAYANGTVLKIAILTLSNNTPTIIAESTLTISSSQTNGFWDMKLLSNNTFVLIGGKGVFLYEFDGNETVTLKASTTEGVSGVYVRDAGYFFRLTEELFVLIKCYYDSGGYTLIVVIYKITQTSIKFLKQTEFSYQSGQSKGVKIYGNSMLIYTNYNNTSDYRNSSTIFHLMEVSEDGTVTKKKEERIKLNVGSPNPSYDYGITNGSLLKLKDKFLLLGVLHRDGNVINAGSDYDYCAIEIKPTRDAILYDPTYANRSVFTKEQFPARVLHREKVWETYIEADDYIWVIDNLKTLSKMKFVDLGMKLPKYPYGSDLSGSDLSGIALAGAKKGQKSKVTILDVK